MRATVVIACLVSALLPDWGKLIAEPLRQDRSDPAVTLQLARRLIAVALRTWRSDQPGPHALACTRKRIKDGEIRMSSCQCLNLLIVSAGNRFRQTVSDACDASQSHPGRLSPARASRFPRTRRLQT